MPYNWPMTPPISHDAIAALCRDNAAQGLAIEIVEETGSTNADLLARLTDAPALAGPVALIARRQTAGRGRAGRTWHSDGTGLTFSLAWPVRQPLTALSGLPLAIGVAIAEVLAARGIPVTLKWPNDVLLDGYKLAGILIETIDESRLLHNQLWVVIGIGINIAGPERFLETSAPSHEELRGNLESSGMAFAALPPTDRNALLAALFGSLVQTLRDFEQHRFAAFAMRWNALHAHTGQAVDILDGARVVHSGHAVGVDAHGRLLLQTDYGQLAIVAGDVSLRKAGQSGGKHVAAG